VTSGVHSWARLEKFVATLLTISNNLNQVGSLCYSVMLLAMCYNLKIAQRINAILKTAAYGRNVC